MSACHSAAAAPDLVRDYVDVFAIEQKSGLKIKDIDEN